MNFRDENSTQLAIDLLGNDIFIKDLRTKNSFAGTNFVRIAIKSEEENNQLIESFKKAFNGKSRTRN